MTHIGKRIRDLRIAKGLTLPELADKAGISKSYLWRIEESSEDGSGTRPSGATLSKIGSALEVSVATLMGEEATARSVNYVESKPHIPDLPGTLVTYIESCRKNHKPLDEEEIRMLAGIRYRGRVPESVEDWDYILRTIQRVLD